MFGTISEVPGDDHEGGFRLGYLYLAIIRCSEDNGELIEVATSHVRLNSSPYGIIQGSSPVEYMFST